MSKTFEAVKAGWSVEHHRGAGFRGIRNNAATDADVTVYCSTELEAWGVVKERMARTIKTGDKGVCLVSTEGGEVGRGKIIQSRIDITEKGVTNYWSGWTKTDDWTYLSDHAVWAHKPDLNEIVRQLSKQPELGATPDAAINGGQKRYIVWLQNGRNEAVILDNEADLHYLLTGDTSKYDRSTDIGVGALADEMRTRWLDDADEIVVQEFNLNEFDMKAMTSMRREKLVFDDEQDSEGEDD